MGTRFNATTGRTETAVLPEAGTSEPERRYETVVVNGVEYKRCQDGCCSCSEDGYDCCFCDYAGTPPEEQP